MSNIKTLLVYFIVACMLFSCAGCSGEGQSVWSQEQIAQKATCAGNDPVSKYIQGQEQIVLCENVSLIGLAFVSTKGLTLAPEIGSQIVGGVETVVNGTLTLVQVALPLAMLASLSGDTVAFMAAPAAVEFAKANIAWQATLADGAILTLTNAGRMYDPYSMTIVSASENLEMAMRSATFDTAVLGAIWSSGKVVGLVVDSGLIKSENLASQEIQGLVWATHAAILNTIAIGTHIPVDQEHNQEHTPALGGPAATRADTVLKSWVAIQTWVTATNFNKPPTNTDSDRFRCVATVFAGEIVRFGVFEAYKIVPGGNVYGHMSIWAADGSGWVTSFTEARFSKEMYTPARDLQKLANELGVSVENIPYSCGNIGGKGGPPALTITAG